jgi:hypothetical protein
MMSLLARNKLLLILLGLVILGVAWYFFSGSSDTPDLLETTAGPAGLSANPQEADLVQTLLALRAVSLSGTIFSDPAFMSLRDFGTQIIPEPIGRPNPFAPLGVSGAGTTTPRGR